jgi:hypothetical protein
VYENGRIPTLEDITDVALRARVQALGLEKEAIAMPTEVDPVVLDNIEGNPAKYLNKDYLLANRHKMPDPKFRDYMSKVNNGDITSTAPVGSDKFADILIKNGMQRLVRPTDDAGWKSHYRIRSALIDEARDFEMNNKRKMTPLEAETALEEIITRKVYSYSGVGSGFLLLQETWSEMGLEAEIDNFDPNESYYRLGENRYIRVASWDAIMNEMSSRGLLGPQHSKQQQAVYFGIIREELMKQGKIAK